MRKPIVDEWLTLDGVAQAPGEPDEDTSDGFQHGGWHMRYGDDTFREWVLTNLTEAGGLYSGAGHTRASPPTGRTREGKNSHSPSP
jgi:hypothetical protein